MKRLYGVLFLVLMAAALWLTLQARDHWIEGRLGSRRARMIRSAEPQWPNLSQAPHANRPVEQVEQ
ncbi:MAG: hypothetical protein JSU68_11010 [Phycisphaerales bacterium]|nr:MAG: hypothetical protein JSU68_11010 [Phycisphaerales bacterium]